MAISVFDLFKIGVGPSSSHTVDPLLIEPRLLDLRETQCLLLVGELRVPFVWRRNMQLLDENLPYHPNAMTYYSVGGGFVVDQQQAASGQLNRDQSELPYDFGTAAQMLSQCKAQLP